MLVSFKGMSGRALRRPVFLSSMNGVYWAKQIISNI